nr:hypothetical protein [uncultured Allomuricauda sp.]
MKKIVFTSILLATVFIVLGGMNAFQKIESLNFASKSDSNMEEPVYTVKYNDFITEVDFPDGYSLDTMEATNHVDWNFLKVNESVKKYGNSLDSTLKNLNTLDAHNFIHQAFNKAKSAVSKSDISDIQKYYHCEIMRVCYDRDRSLNQSTIRRL